MEEMDDWLEEGLRDMFRNISNINDNIIRIDEELNTLMERKK